MERSKKIFRQSYKHLFYCDECNKYLGTSEEFDDGYYARFGDFELSVNVLGERYNIEKTLCDECKNVFLDNLKSTLTNLGFRKKIEFEF